MAGSTGKNKTTLLLGNYRPALTLARTLSANGYKIMVGTHGCDYCCEHSRFVSQMWDHSENGEYSPEQIYRMRQEEAKPILDNFEKWLKKKKLQTPPKGAARQGCCLHLEPVAPACRLH